MNSLPDNELLNKDQNGGTGHEGEKSGFQPKPTIFEALQVNTSMTEDLRSKERTYSPKRKKRKHAYSSLVGQSQSTAFAKAMRQTTSDPFTAADEEFTVNEEDGEYLSPSLATFLTKWFPTQTDPKKLKAKFDHYKRPANCQILTAPQTNKEIWRSLKNFGQKD